MDSFAVPPGAVVITPTELYKEMQATHTVVTEMRGDLREVLRRLEDNAAQVREHEIRMRAVEDLAAKTAGTVDQHSAQLAEVVTGRRYRITTTVAVLAVLIGLGSWIVAIIAVIGGT